MGRTRRVRQRAFAIVGCTVVVGLGLGIMAPGAKSRETLSPAAGQSSARSEALPPVGAQGIDPTTYAALFGDLIADPPTGTIVADSGFRPYPNGFSFVNYGSSMELNQRLFAQPSALTTSSSAASAQGLSASSMRQVFGDGVCIPGTSPACRLTESAKVVQLAARAWAEAGRCFGLATMANALFTGKRPASEVKAGVVNTLTTLNSGTQQAIMRAFVAQYFSALAIRPTSMSDAISRLRTGLSAGQIPFTMLIYGAPGGHALVPYAVYDRGAGAFDIAVYDPSLPNQQRAVHVDTVANSWRYTGAPGVRSSFWSSSDAQNPAYFLLGLPDTALGRQACPFCPTGTAASLVTFSAVHAVNSRIFDNISLRDAAGRPLDPTSYRVVRPTDDSTHGVTAAPVFIVDSHTDFEIFIDGEHVETAQPFVARVIAPGRTRSLRIETLNSSLRGSIRVGARSGALAFTGTPLNKGTVLHTFEQSGASYAFKGVETAAYHQESIHLGSSQSASRVIFRENDPFDSQWNVSLESQDRSGDSTYTARGVEVPAGGRLVVVFDGWRGSAGRPQLWLDLRSNGSLDERIPLRES